MTKLISGTSDSRMDALTDATRLFLDNPEIEGINIGLMGFSNGDSLPRPHGVSVPISPIDAEITPIMLSNLVPSYLSTGSNYGYFSLADDNLPDPVSGQTIRQYLPDVIGSWEADGGTPIVDALHEAALYFKGLAPKWGAVSAEQNNAAHPSSYEGFITSTMTNGEKVNSGSAVYKSPMAHQCQNNAIILMSDGSPNAYSQDETAETREQIKNMVGRTTDCTAVSGQVVPVSEYNQLADGRCGVELADYLSTEDQSASVDGNNVVKTYTVGFEVDDRPEAEAYLQSLADSGGGQYFPAYDSVSLAEAFISITQHSSTKPRSFTAPVYSVDVNSALANSRDIYLPLFTNSESPAWFGNLKKFKLDDAGRIIDANGLAAIDETGQLKTTAVDFWMPEGAELDDASNAITSGGFANNINPASRNILTDNRGALVSLDEDNVSKLDLGDASMSDTYRDELLSYISGYEYDGVTPRHAIGDILHSKPTLISYDDKQVLFFGTNEGFLHAVDAADASDGGGVEKFAFMPESLLDNIQGIYTNTVMPSDGLSRIYGVDGSIVAHIKDNNNNGKVDVSDGDEATLILGLRRGGNSYYALDVTDPESPKLKWIINNSGQFSNLGETWSPPVPAKLRYLKSGTVTLANVLVFGGGYDDRLDEEDPAARSSLSGATGNGVYIVDLETGALIWSYVGQQLDHSVPGSIRTLDIDGDGSIERLYFGDTGGNLWRVDLNAYDNEEGYELYDVEKNAQVSHFADLSGVGGDERKFFYAPDVSFFKSAGKEVLLVSIGSGYRSHPLNVNIDDRFYVLSDDDVRSVPSTSKSALTYNDLVSNESLNGESFLPEHKGWYKSLTKGSGEKVLAPAITFMQQIAFTTFAVDSSATPSIDETGCLINGANITSVYVLDLLTGGATADLDGDGIINEDDESVIVLGGDILDTPQLHFNEPSNCTNDGCDHFVDLRIGTSLTPLIDESTEGGDNNLGGYLPKVFWLNSN